MRLRRLQRKLDREVNEGLRALIEDPSTPFKEADPEDAARALREWAARRVPKTDHEE
jgi:hypothetical protein